MRRHDFGKNSLPARAMEEDTSTFARAPKKMPPLALPHDPSTPMWVSRDCRVRNNFVPNTASAIGVWVHPSGGGDSNVSCTCGRGRDQIHEILWIYG